MGQSEAKGVTGCAQILEFAEGCFEKGGRGDAGGAAAERPRLKRAGREGGENAGVKREEGVAKGRRPAGEEALLEEAGAGSPPGTRRWRPCGRRSS